jgi:6-phosphogluconolactonase (cycloisomerase 2 family)
MPIGHRITLARLALLALLTTGASMSRADDAVQLLIGGYTQNASQGIYRYRFDPHGGRIDGPPLQVVATSNPSWLVLDRNRLYAVNENGPGQPDPVGHASSFAIAAHTGALSRLSQRDSGGDEPTYASLSADRRYLFVANYAVKPTPGGSLAVLPVDGDGRLGAVTQQFSNPPSGVDKARQASSHVHSAVPSPDGRYLFACDLGGDRVYSYRYDPANQAQPLAPASTAFTQLAPGSGPRHLLFSADGARAYLTLEMANRVVLFDYADGMLHPRQQLDLLPAGHSGQQRAGALHASADGRFLYVSERGDDNLLLVFAIDAASGELREIQRRPADGKEPREFALSADGRHLLLANQFSDEVLVIARDPATGLLGETLQRLAIHQPSDVKFLLVH